MDDPALITVTGFDYNAFHKTLELFKPYFDGYTPWTSRSSDSGFKFKRVSTDKRGRKRIVTAAACLGMVLAWYRFRGSEFILQGWFGFTGAHLNVWLRFGKRMLLKTLIHHPDCIVMMPSVEKIKYYQGLIHAPHKALKDVFCVADSLKLPFQACDELHEQSRFYNG